MPRRADIVRAKGFAIVLVVFGHLVARADPAGVGWYEPLRRAVYAFHMPLFLYLSGLVAVLSGMVLQPRRDWVRVARARALRLLAPFFALGVAVVMGKFLLARWMAVDNMPASLGAGLAGLVWRTGESPALSTWYLFVLFAVSLAVMVALDGRPRRAGWAVAAGLILYALPLPAVMYADRVGRYAVFFILGVTAGLAGARWDAFVDRTWRRWMGVLLVSLALVAGFGTTWPEKLTLLPVGVVSMPAIHGWLRYLRQDSLPGLIFLGRYSFMIYLFNTAFIGLAKGVMLHFAAWDGANFLPFAAVLMAAGVLGPIGLKQTVFSRIRVLDRLTD
jgi:fucose 4-O-acetylase-like acetyltransferase